MKSPVYFVDMRTKHNDSLVHKLGRLLDAIELEKSIRKGALTALKIHFGEKGNQAYIHPCFVRQIVERVKTAGGHPFITDTNTLYSGSRSDAVSHLNTAIQHGFAYAVVDAPLIIADGLRGSSEIAVPVNLARCKEVFIGAEIVRADVIVSAAHFKGHELAGFGGALKNIGMGCASRRGKLAQHSTVSPKVKTKKCIGCGQCLDYCSHGALSLAGQYATIDSNKCAGCGECIIICEQGAIQIMWDQTIPEFMETMVEYAYGVLKRSQIAATFINFITQVSPACDCYPHNDASIVPDIGIVASNDPVAIDQASADLVNQAKGRTDSALQANFEPGADKFRGIYPQVEWELQLAYAEKIGLGSRNYELVRL